MSTRASVVALLVALTSPAVAPAATVLVEAESFTDHGGWSLDTQFIREMGSPYLLAHGLGTPVADATTTVRIPAAGTYHAWVRTKDWVARWQAAAIRGWGQRSPRPAWASKWPSCKTVPSSAATARAKFGSGRWG